MDMCRARGCFLLLLPLTLCSINPEVFLEKHIGTDMTPLCNNETSNLIKVIKCQIQTVENGDVLCSLLPEQWNETCISRITLIIQNQTAFLRLPDLTPADSGVYNCSCTREEDVFTLHFNVTVQVNGQNNSENNHKFLIISACGSSLTAFIVVFAVTLGCIYRGNGCRQQTPVAGSEEMDMYETLREPPEDLYQRITDKNSAEVWGLDQINNDTDYENVRCVK